MLPIPPPVDDLRLRLHCPHLRRHRTTVKLAIRPVPVGQMLLIARVRARGRIRGLVAFSIGGRVLATVPVLRRDGLVRVAVRARRGRVVAAYRGDAAHAPGRTAARR